MPKKKEYFEFEVVGDDTSIQFKEQPKGKLYITCGSMHDWGSIELSKENTKRLLEFLLKTHTETGKLFYGKN